MSTLKLQGFAGEVPRVEPHLLENNQADRANNVKLFSGSLKAWFAPAAVRAKSRTGIVRTIFRLPKPGFTDIWLEWNNDVNVVRSPLTGDVLSRIYYTGDGVPKQTWYDALAAGSYPHPSSWKRLGVPQPAAAPTVTPSGGTAANVTRFYTYVYVTALGEMGPPATPTKAVSPSDATWGISGMSGALAAEYNITKKRIYRTVVGESGTDFFFVAEIDVATTSYNDTATEAVVALNEVMRSRLWFPPPDGLQGLVGMPNGTMAGFVGNSVYFCEPFQFHAWPEIYRVSVSYPIVGLAAFGTTVVVATEGTPYLISGADPAAMSMAKIDVYEPCKSKRGIVSTVQGALYPGANGLVNIGAGGISRVTRAFYTRDEWEEERPEQLFAAVWDDRYFALRNTYDFPEFKRGGFILDPQEPRVAVSVLDEHDCTALFTDPETGVLYGANDFGIVEFDGDQANTLFYLWRSKIFVTPRPINFGAAVLHAEFGEISDAALSAAITTLVNNFNAALYAALNDTPVNELGYAINSFEINQVFHVVPSSNLAYPFTDNDLPAITPEVMNYADGVGGTVGGTRMLVSAGAVTAREVTVRLYADGELVFSQSIASNDMFRLPSGYKATHWQVELTGNMTVHHIEIAETAKELASV